MSDFNNPNEKLYRAVKPAPQFIKENGKITSGAFKSIRASVDRQANRANTLAVEFIKQNHPNNLIVSITKQICMENTIDCVQAPVEGNPYHCELIRSDGNERLSSSQAKHLADECFIEYYV